MLNINNKISVIIPTYNKSKRLKLTLACFVSQTMLNNVEILLVDNGSTDTTCDVVNFFKDKLPIRYMSYYKRGRASARNFGAQNACGDLFIFIDDDILFKSDFIATHYKLQSQDQSYLHGALRELIGLIRVDDPSQGGPGIPRLSVDDIMQNGFDPKNCRYVTNILEKAAEAFLAPISSHKIPWLAGAGANFSIPKHIWDSVGGFDINFDNNWGCEDLEFALRVHKNKFNVKISTNITGYHQSHNPYSRWDEHNINLSYFIDKHPIPEVIALRSLLSKNGSIRNYIQTIEKLVYINAMET